MGKINLPFSANLGFRKNIGFDQNCHRRSLFFLLFLMNVMNLYGRLDFDFVLVWMNNLRS